MEQGFPNIGFYTKSSTGSGIGNYESELVDNLNERPDINLETIIPVSYDFPVLGDYLTYSFGVQRRLANLNRNLDVLHLPSQFQAAGLYDLNINAKVVVTVHDIIPYVSTRYANSLLRSFSNIYVRGLQNADQIVAISEYTKQDLLEYTEIHPNKITVIRPAINPDLFDNPSPKKTLTKYGVSEPYLLYVGQQGSKKNIEVVLSSLSKMRDQNDISLVIAGGAGNALQPLRTKIYAKRYDVQDRIALTGYVPQKDLARLYHSATAFVFPSKYEGFGRPPLEAMSTGTPVIASSSTAIPEILDEAAILCDPSKPNEWKEAIYQVLRSKETREKLISQGYERVSELNWEDSADRTVELYRDVLADMA